MTVNCAGAIVTRERTAMVQSKSQKTYLHQTDQSLDWLHQMGYKYFAEIKSRGKIKQEQLGSK